MKKTKSCGRDSRKWHSLTRRVPFCCEPSNKKASWSFGRRMRKTSRTSSYTNIDLHVVGNSGTQAPLRGRTSAGGLLRIGLVQPAEQFLPEPSHQLSERFRPHPRFA